MRLLPVNCLFDAGESDPSGGSSKVTCPEREVIDCHFDLLLRGSEGYERFRFEDRFAGLLLSP